MDDLSIIPAFRERTPAERKASALVQHALADYSYLNNIPQAWLELSMETKFFPLSPADIETIIWCHGTREEVARAEARMFNLERRLDTFFDDMMWFVKLHSRSPKDIADTPIACCGKQALFYIASSKRCFDDLIVHYDAEKPAYIVARQWLPMKPRDEFRCFVKDGKLIAISQYDYFDGPQYKLQSKHLRDTLWSKIQDWWQASMEAKRPADYPNTYVFDLWLPDGFEGRKMLIEVNPYGMSDPCSARSYQAIEKTGGFFYERPSSSEVA